MKEILGIQTTAHVGVYTDLRVGLFVFLVSYGRFTRQKGSTGCPSNLALSINRGNHYRPPYIQILTMGHPKETSDFGKP